MHCRDYLCLKSNTNLINIIKYTDMKVNMSDKGVGRRLLKFCRIGRSHKKKLGGDLSHWVTKTNFVMGHEACQLILAGVCPFFLHQLQIFAIFISKFSFLRVLANIE